MEIFLQVWGGSFYLLAKVFLSGAEGNESSPWRVRGWIVFLLGIPAWVIVLGKENAWIAAGVEAGGAPSMLLGIAIAREWKIPTWTRTGAKVLAWGLIILGIVYSWYDFGGIRSLSQVLELLITTGYLAGTYLLAKKDGRGWLWFVLMNANMAILNMIQGKWIFFLLQVVSVGFGIYGFRKFKAAKHQSLAS
jgi:hypothetical protein